MPARLIVDHNHVMGSRPDGRRRDRAGAARRLVEDDRRVRDQPPVPLTIRTSVLTT
jgi:hypothetical protein